jgi:hypothetical protein
MGAGTGSSGGSGAGESGAGESGAGESGLRFCDDGEAEVILESDDAARLWQVTGGLEDATISACLECRSRVLAAVALVELLDVSPPVPMSTALGELADDAPTLHLYVEDLGTECAHRTWLDPLAEEWSEVVEGSGRPPVH